MSYHEARWSVEVLWTRAHSKDVAQRISIRAKIKRTIRLVHQNRYH